MDEEELKKAMLFLWYWNCCSPLLANTKIEHRITPFLSLRLCEAVALTVLASRERVGGGAIANDRVEKHGFLSHIVVLTLPSWEEVPGVL